ncbi:MAG TPA: type II secretion system protein [Thermoanaerobaculia bacterium]|nr:type II secretion system protein [Thermoanaerobaculia bacterium]
MSRTRSSESGFTLAGLIVIMTVIAVFIAYTVPRQWSLLVGRDRDQQTLFAMKQYARAIRAFQEKNKTAPVSLDQLKQARNPRFLRGSGELIDPLTGKVDWIVIPAGAAQQAAGQPTPGVPQQPDGGLLVGYRGRPATPPPQTSVPVNPTQQAGQPGGFVGPIIGVRPNKSGTSYILVNGSDSYEQWSYTILDLEQEINQRRNAVMVK